MLSMHVLSLHAWMVGLHAWIVGFHAWVVSEIGGDCRWVTECAGGRWSLPEKGAGIFYFEFLDFLRKAKWP